MIHLSIHRHQKVNWRGGDCCKPKSPHLIYISAITILITFSLYPNPPSLLNSIHYGLRQISYFTVYMNCSFHLLCNLFDVSFARCGHSFGFNTVFISCYGGMTPSSSIETSPHAMVLATSPPAPPTALSSASSLDNGGVVNRIIVSRSIIVSLHPLVMIYLLVS